MPTRLPVTVYWISMPREVVRPYLPPTKIFIPARTFFSPKFPCSKQAGNPAEGIEEQKEVNEKGKGKKVATANTLVSDWKFGRLFLVGFTGLIEHDQEAAEHADVASAPAKRATGPQASRDPVHNRTIIDDEPEERE
ncbi:hypothetical protein DL767_006343 [Monosporascus sp. MG133]|nr:hypothetical protein DL767_006343 [Monosporascus sp. MG133]